MNTPARCPRGHAIAFLAPNTPCPTCTTLERRAAARARRTFTKQHPTLCPRCFEALPCRRCQREARAIRRDQKRRGLI